MSYPKHHKSHRVEVNPQPPLKRPAAKLKGEWFFSPNQWAMFVHLAQFTHCVAPLGGIVAPILIWQLKKEELPEIDLCLARAGLCALCFIFPSFNQEPWAIDLRRCRKPSLLLTGASELGIFSVKT